MRDPRRPPTIRSTQNRVLEPRPCRASTPLAALALFASLSLLAGCQAYTCEGACGQYYLSSEGNCGRPSILSDGTTSEGAYDSCVKECTDALYNTANEEVRTLIAAIGGSSRASPTLNFINCVAEQDYSEAAFNQTCADLDYSCAWFRW